MIFIHTSDWHLGRIFHGIHLTDDQAYILNEFVQSLKFIDPDCLIIAGDIYDRTVPPADAIELFNWFLERISLDLQLPVILIAGNHDSPERLGFGAKILSLSNVHIISKPEMVTKSIVLNDDTGPIRFYCLPYAEPAMIREFFPENSIEDHEDAVTVQVKRLTSRALKNERSVLIAHLYTAGGDISESERPLSLGGSSVVPASLFQSFNYVALGHLHRPQFIGNQSINYSGSLLKYAFSESDHEKSFSRVEINRRGHATVERILFKPRRNVRIITGTLEELIARGHRDPCPDDYIQAVLEDKDALLDPMGRLRDIYPNIMHVERSFFTQSPNHLSSGIKRRSMSDIELFNAFCREVNNDSLTAPQQKFLEEIIDQMDREHRSEKS